MCDVVSVTREQEPELEPGDPPEHSAGHSGEGENTVQTRI